MSDTGDSTILPPQAEAPDSKQGIVLPPPAPVDKPRPRKHERKPGSTCKGGELLSTEEKQQITTFSAAGWPPFRIAKHMNRNRHTIKKYLDTPEAVTVVREERAELVEIYREKARDILVSIDAETINKANLLQRATSSGIFLDKSLLLQGRPTQNVAIIVEVLDVLRVRNDEEIERQHQQAKALLSLPANQP